MYGLVNIALQDLITTRHGEDAWERVMAQAGVDAAGFVTTDAYPDEITYRLVGAASPLLGVPATELLERFGEHWVRYVRRTHFGSLMESAGGTVREFLEHLPHLHARVQLHFPALQPPVFRCEAASDGLVRLHYHSTRDGLAPFVVGLLRGVAEMVGQRVAVTHPVRRADGVDHDEFLIEVV